MSDRNTTQVNALVSEWKHEQVREEYPYGTLSKEIQRLVDHLVETAEEAGTYEPIAEPASRVDDLKSDEYPGDWDKRQKEVLMRDDYQCTNCGSRGGPDGKASLHVHHIVPLDVGGNSYVSNLTTLCSDCHDRL